MLSKKSARAERTMLWGHPLAFWNSIGLSLMIAALLLGLITVGIGFASSFILWKVGDTAQAPRSLNAEQIAAITKSVAPFHGLRVVLGAVPPSKANADLTLELLVALQNANVGAFINHGGVGAELDPAQIRGKLVSRGPPAGITAFFVTGNSRGQAFAETLARVLNDAGSVARASGDWRDDWVVWTLKQHAEFTRENKFFEPVTVVVGDKP